MADTKIHAHMCYHVKIGSSASKDVRVCLNRREPQKLGSAGAPLPCDRGVADPLEICSSPTCVILPNLVVLGQTVRALLTSSA